MDPKTATTTAFVLSGGASLGSIQVGMLETLYARGVRPDLIVGTSAGALNGAFIATRPPTAATARELAEVWHGLSRDQIFPLNPITGALGFLGARGHLVPDSGLRALISRHMTVERVEDTPIPLHVVAADLMSGAEIRLSSGPLLEAVMASSAIPGVLPAVDWNDRLLVDGGVANNVPISHAIELGADVIYVLPTGAACELETPPRGALATLVHATSLLVGHRFSIEVAQLSSLAELIILPPPCPLAIQPTDFGHAEELIATARQDAERFLDQREEVVCSHVGAVSAALMPRADRSGLSFEAASRH